MVCLGDSLIDLLPLLEGDVTTGFRMAVGGAMLNVAIGLARLGQPVAFAGKVADDFFAHRIIATITAEGIDTRYLVPSTGHTTLAFTTFESGEPAFTFYGKGTADTLLRTAELPPAFFADTRILHTGSTSLLRGETPETVRTVMRKLRKRALLSLDPNIRPTLVQDERAYRALLDELFALADLVKVSAADLAWLAPGEEIETVAARILECGPALVAVTGGQTGAYAVTRHGVHVRASSFRVEVVDTVGAGDAFSAGLLSAISERELTTPAALAALDKATLRELVRWASATAALNCTRPGANPPSRADLERFLISTASPRGEASPRSLP